MTPIPPLVLLEPRFPLRALAMAVAHAPLGGGRETLLATLVAVRLAMAAHGPQALPEALRAERAAAAHHWLGAVSLAPAVRQALDGLLDASVRGDAPALATALANVTEITAPHLDRKARSELERFRRSLEA